ncbi:Low-temperature-induced 65 kDa protein [Cardamine amara subsp. amara]|uniref:Low-temperature-induced 65 kDa protein n=1 Tax=Cardamine amara subsp. amara TaxID=228776 RepID=A0ABD0ZUS6_CARAN
MQSQLTRPYGHDQAEEPIRIHHPEEEEHHEKEASKVLKKVKEKAKKIKNTLTKNGHGHEHDHDVDQEDGEYDKPDPEVHGAPVYESSAVRGGVTGQPESLSQAGETNVPALEEIIPPGTKAFPVVSSDYTKHVEPEPLQDTLYGHEALSHPVRTTDTSDKEERREAPIYHPLKASDLTDREESREAHHEPMNTPLSLLSTTEDVTRTFAPGGEDEHLGGQRKVNIERPKGLEEDPAAPGGGSDYLSGVSNYQSKVTDFTKEGGGEVGVPKIAESLGKMKVTDESPDQETGPGLEKDFDRQSEFGIGKDSPKRFVAESGAELGKDFPTRSHEFDQNTESKTSKDSPARFGAESGAALEGDFSTTELKRDLPTGTHDQFSPELSRPKERDDFEKTKNETTQQTKPSTYTEKFASATSPITDKVIAAKDAMASKLGYSGESGGGGQYESSVRDETPRSAMGYGQKVAGTVAEKLTPVYEKVKETGSNVMTKLPLSGGGGVEETQQGEGKTVSARDYLSGKLRPGEEDKALSEVIAEKLHLGGGGEKKTSTTKEMEVTVEKIPTEKELEGRGHDEAVGEEGKGGGMAGKIKGAVTSWLGGTKPKSPHSVEESSQSLGTTVGTTGFSDSGGSELTGKTGVGSGAVPVQRGLGN